MRDALPKRLVRKLCGQKPAAGVRGARPDFVFVFCAKLITPPEAGNIPAFRKIDQQRILISAVTIILLELEAQAACEDTD